MENLIIYLAQTGAPKSSPLMQFLPFILLMVGFWFLLIQPQRKKQKQLILFRIVKEGFPISCTTSLSF